MADWKLYSHDLWGNRKDGYTINDYYLQGTVALKGEYPSKAEVLKALKTDGWIKKRVHAKSIEVEVHEDDIYITDLRTGIPELTLRKETQVRGNR